MKETKISDRVVQRYSVCQNFYELGYYEVHDDTDSLIIEIETEIIDNRPQIKLGVLDDSFDITFQEIIALKDILNSEEFEQIQDDINYHLTLYKQQLNKRIATKNLLEALLESAELSEEQKDILKKARNLVSSL